MKIAEKLNITHSLKTYFNADSDEFKQVDFEEKMAFLSKVIASGFDLNELINEYKTASDFSDENLIPTLKMYISYIKFDVPFYFRKLEYLNSKTEKEIIELLKDLILETNQE